MTARGRLALLVLLAAGLAGSVAALRAQEPATTEAVAVDQLLEPEQLVGPPGATPLAGAALDTQTEEVAALLRCPVCQGLSVADSPATMAVNMKIQVREMLSRGYTEDQILSYFEGSYGEFVRLEPPLRGVNWLVWLAPVAGLLLGGIVVARALKARGAAAPTPEKNAAPALPARDTLPDDPELAPYVRRVRELAYGWPGGTPPGEDA